MESIKSITDRYHARSQEEIDDALMHEIEASNEPNHEACAYNNCKACVGE